MSYWPTGSLCLTFGENLKEGEKGPFLLYSFMISDPLYRILRDLSPRN